MKKRILSGNMPNRKLVVEIISALFILLFLYTAITKSFSIQTTINVISKTPLASSFAEATAWGVIVLEYLISLLLFLPHTRKIGLYCSTGLMTVFTIYIGYMKVFVPDLPCSCGGVISKLSWSQHLLFNIVFTCLAVTAIFLERKQHLKVNHQVQNIKTALT